MFNVNIVAKYGQTLNLMMHMFLLSSYQPTPKYPLLTPESLKIGKQNYSERMKHGFLDQRRESSSLSK